MSVRLLSCSNSSEELLASMVFCLEFETVRLMEMEYQMPKVKEALLREARRLKDDQLASRGLERRILRSTKNDRIEVAFPDLCALVNNEVDVGLKTLAMSLVLGIQGAQLFTDTDILKIAAKFIASFRKGKIGPCALPIRNPSAGGASGGGGNGGGASGGGENGGRASGGGGNGGGGNGGGGNCGGGNGGGGDGRGGNGGGGNGGGGNGGGGDGRGGNGGGGNGGRGRDWFQVLSQVLSNILTLLNLLVAIAALSNHNILAILSIDNAIAVSLVTLLTALIMLLLYIFRAF